MIWDESPNENVRYHPAPVFHMFRLMFRLACAQMRFCHQIRQSCLLSLVQDAANIDLDSLVIDQQPSPDPISRPATAGVAHSARSLCRYTRNLVGREQQVVAVLGSLHQHGAAVIWGSPGEGKTAVAAEAGCRLQEDVTADIHLSVIVDMISAHASALRWS